MRRLRLALRVLLALAVLAVAGYLYLAYAPAGDSAAHPFNQDRNAVWLEHRWLEKDQPPEEMEALLQSLDRHGIAYVVSRTSSPSTAPAACPSTAASRCATSWPWRGGWRRG